MSCGTCGIQASDTMQGDTGVPAGAPTTSNRPRCPHCKAFISQEGAPCYNRRCTGPPPPAPPLSFGEQALDTAAQVGPADDTRAVACQSHPYYALLYARRVDEGPRDDTRQAACQMPRFAFFYACDVDQGPRDDTRAAACREPEMAVEYARRVDKSPRDDTRQAACREAKSALEYALTVDEGSHALTRSGTLGDPAQAETYARLVDHCPRDDTRAAACQDPEWAYNYALQVDRAPRDDTRQAACRKAAAAFAYACSVDKGPRADTRKAAGRSQKYRARYAAWERSLPGYAGPPAAPGAAPARQEEEAIAFLRAQNNGELPFFTPDGAPYVYITQHKNQLCATCADEFAAEAAESGEAAVDPVTGYKVWDRGQGASTFCDECAYEFVPAGGNQ